MYQPYGSTDPYRNPFAFKKNQSAGWLGGSSNIGQIVADPEYDRKMQMDYGTPLYRNTTGVPRLNNTTGLPKLKNTLGLPNRLSYKNGEWTNSVQFGISPSGGAFYHQKMPYGWNPFKTGVPWTQKRSIGSDASRQGSYLGGITHSAPQMSYMGTYQDKALTDKPYGSAGYKRGINQNYRKMPYFL